MKERDTQENIDHWRRLRSSTLIREFFFEVAGSSELRYTTEELARDGDVIEKLMAEIICLDKKA